MLFASGTTSHAHRPPVGARRPTILVVDDDEPTCATLVRALDLQSYAVHTAGSCATGLALARSIAPDLLIVDLRLVDNPGIEIIRTLQAEGHFPRFIVASKWIIDTALVVEAMRRGAFTVVEGPLWIEDVAPTVRAALAADPPSLADEISPHPGPRHRALVLDERHPPAKRLALYILKGSRSQQDLPTIKDWVECLPIGVSTLFGVCGMVDVTPKTALDLARLIRLARRGEPPEIALAYGDDRTRRALLDRAGFSADWPASISVAQFLRRQTLVPRGSALLQVLQRLVEDDINGNLPL